MGLMKPDYLLDSVILIDHLNGVAQATRYLDRLKDGAAVISAITRAEVLTGATPDTAYILKSFLDQFECLPLTAVIADSAALLRQKNKWKLPDAFQAAIALNHELKFVTRNTKDFDRKKYAFVQIPYVL